MIYKINKYIDSRGIEMQEREPMDNRLPLLYQAMVTVGVNTPEGSYPQVVKTEEYSADDIHEAYEESDAKLQKAIKKFQEEMTQMAAEAKDEAMGPRIIMPD